MHDCPRCKVPLHGYEKRCPSCDTPQYVSPEYENLDDNFARPKTNVLPYVLFVLLLIGFAGYFAYQYTWVGELFKAEKNPVKVLSVEESRNKIIETINNDFKSINVEYKCKYLNQGKEVPLNSPNSIDLDIEAKLTDKKQRANIVPSIKSYLDTAKIGSIVIKDLKSKATWTYSITQGQADNSNADGGNSEGGNDANSNDSAP